MPAAGGGQIRGGDEGAPRLCGNPSPEWLESVPVNLSAKRFEVWDPRSGSWGKSRLEGEGVLDGALGCPAGVCVAAGDLLALCASIFADFLRLYGSPGAAPGDPRSLIPQGTRPWYAHQSPWPQRDPGPGERGGGRLQPHPRLAGGRVAMPEDAPSPMLSARK